MAEHSSAQISHNSSTAAAGPAAPDTELAALTEKRLAAWALIGEVDDDAADAAFDDMDRLDALIATTPARTLDGVRLKAGVCHAIASGDLEEAWPMLRSILTDLQRVPLDDEAKLRSIFAALAMPLPPLPPDAA